MTKQPAKRIDIVSVKLVKEKSVLYEPRTINRTSDVSTLINSLIGDNDREYLVVIGINTKNEPTIINTAHVGSLNQSIAHPREIMKPLILSNAARFILAHNHPSGNLEPSDQDIQLTKWMKEVGELIGIQLIDHLIVHDGSFYSLTEHGDF